MCNCGRKRLDGAGNGRPLRGEVTATGVGNNKLWQDVFFEYTGHTGVTVTGRVTGRPYRFPEPGARVAVDYRDAMAMMAVPVLRRA